MKNKSNKAVGRNEAEIGVHEAAQVAEVVDPGEEVADVVGNVSLLGRLIFQLGLEETAESYD